MLNNKIKIEGMIIIKNFNDNQDNKNKFGNEFMNSIKNIANKERNEESSMLDSSQKFRDQQEELRQRNLNNRNDNE